MSPPVARIPIENGARVLTVRRNGHIAVTVHDHPNPIAHAGYSLHFEPARKLAEALIDGPSRHGGRVRVPTLEGRILRLQGIRLGDEAKWNWAADPDGLPQRRVGFSPWSLDERERPALGRAILAAVAELP
jgi:hypothetical protein